MLDISFHNSGSRPAVIDTVRIRTLKKETQLTLSLYAQEIVDPNYTLGDQKLLKGKTKLSTFVPVILPRDSVKSARLWMSPFVSSLPIKLEEILATDTLIIDIKINGKWHDGVFYLPFTDYREKYNPDGSYSVPEQFTPRWFLNISSQILKGGFFTNQ
jgi:hypothetical protein